MAAPIEIFTLQLAFPNSLKGLSISRNLSGKKSFLLTTKPLKIPAFNFAPGARAEFTDYHVETLSSFLYVHVMTSAGPPSLFIANRCMTGRFLAAVWRAPTRHVYFFTATTISTDHTMLYSLLYDPATSSAITKGQISTSLCTIVKLSMTAANLKMFYRAKPI
jgi:hypothetical protein